MPATPWTGAESAVGMNVSTALEGVEQTAVQHRVKRAPQALEPERVSRDELSLDPAVARLRPRHRERRFSDVKTQDRQPQRGHEKAVLAGPAAGIEHRSGESAFGCQAHDRRLRLAGIPRCRAIEVRRLPGHSCHPFVTGRLPAAERILSDGS